MSPIKTYSFRQRLRFALAGWGEAFRGETNFRIQVAVAVLLVPFMAWLRPAAIWWALVGLCVGLVLAAELFNTALERLLDGIHPEKAEFVRQAKDCAAGAVLATGLGAALVFLGMVISVIL